MQTLLERSPHRPSIMLTPEQQASDETTPIAQLRELAEQSTALARLVAGNFSADSELLRTLAAHDDRVVQQLVAANPNVPLDVLEKLAKQYLRQVLNNPAIDLFLLEKPNLLEKVSLNNLPVAELIKRSLVSTKFLDYAAKLPDEKVQMAIAMNPETSREILEQLIESQTVQVVEAAGMHINWNEEISKNWRPIFQREIKVTLTRKRERLKTALRRCKTEKLIYTKGVAAWHPSEDEVSLFKGSLVHRLMFLLVWITIAFIFVVYAFLWIISSIATLTVITARLLKNLEDFILQRKPIARGSLSSTNRIEQLMRQAQAKLQSDSVISKWVYVEDLERIACHSKVTAEMLEELLLHEKESVRAKAFKNPNLLRFITEVWSVEMLNSLEWYPLSLIAEKMDTPTRVLEKLAQCNLGSIQRETRNNPNANKQVIEWWQKSSGYVDGDLERWLQNENAWFEEWAALPIHSRLTILIHPKAPIEILAQAFRSDWWLERCAIAQNPSTPRSIRQRLAEDGNWVVRAAARETLSR